MTLRLRMAGTALLVSSALLVGALAVGEVSRPDPFTQDTDSRDEPVVADVMGGWPMTSAGATVAWKLGVTAGSGLERNSPFVRSRAVYRDDKLSITVVAGKRGAKVECWVHVRGEERLHREGTTKITCVYRIT